MATQAISYGGRKRTVEFLQDWLMFNVEIGQFVFDPVKSKNTLLLYATSCEHVDRDDNVVCKKEYFLYLSFSLRHFNCTTPAHVTHARTFEEVVVPRYPDHGIINNNTPFVLFSFLSEMVRKRNKKKLLFFSVRNDPNQSINQ